LAKALEFPTRNFAKRKRESRKNGKLRGIAVGSYLEVTAPPSGELGKISFDPDGSVTLTTGTLDYGQGHATPFAQVLTAQLGVPLTRSNWNRATAISSASATAPAARAPLQRRDKRSSKLRHSWSTGQEGGGALPRSVEADIEFAGGRFTIAGTDRSIGIMELAERVRENKMPEGTPNSLDVDHATRIRLRLSPTAAMSPRSRSIRTPA